MFPGFGFLNGHIHGVNPLPGAIHLENVLAGAINPTHDLSHLLLTAQSNLANPLSPMAASYSTPHSGAQLLPGLPVSYTVNPLLAQLGLSSAFPLVNPCLMFQSPTSEPFVEESPDAHTIIRAPVLYGNKNSNCTNIASSAIIPSSPAASTSKSPPDRIVASYAAAARAAAIAYQQPLSNAAEVFFLTSSSAGSGMSTKTAAPASRNRASHGGVHRVSSGAIKKMMNEKVTKTAGESAQSCWTKRPSTFNDVDAPPLAWNSAWTRMFDRQADVVVYISPGGSRLKSMADVRTYLRRHLAAEKAVAINDEMIAASFCFDASREACLVAGPDDSVFVFPEVPEPLCEAAAAATTKIDASSATTLSASQLAPSRSQARTLVTVSDSSEAATTVTTTSPVVVQLTVDVEQTKVTLNGVASEELPLCSPNKLPHLHSDSARTDDDCCGPSVTKRSKLVSPPGSLSSATATTLVTPPPLLSLAGESLGVGTNASQTTTPTFVLRAGPTTTSSGTVAPSVVPSVLPPSTMPSLYAKQPLLMAALPNQQQELLAAAYLLQMSSGALAEPHTQLLEPYKLQQMSVASAFMLQQQQQQQNQLQMQQLLQTLYAAALQSRLRQHHQNQQTPPQ